MTAFFVYYDIYKEKEQHGVALKYECNEQSTAELQKLSVFHTTVTYATQKYIYYLKWTIKIPKILGTINPTTFCISAENQWFNVLGCQS